MKTITKEVYTKMFNNNCAKGKHKLYENRFGITWCTICGALAKGGVPSDPDTHLPMNIHEPLYIVG